MYEGKIYTHIEVGFSFKDRLKILFGMPLFLLVETKTENNPGKCRSDTSIVSISKKKKKLKEKECLVIRSGNNV